MGPAITRRALLARGLAATSGAALSAALPSVAPAAMRRSAGGLPSAEKLRREVREMVELGPRLPATKAHREFVDGLEDGFRAARLSTSRDRHGFTQWTPSRWSLEVAGERVPVASYYTYSGVTPPSGVTGPLVYAGPLPAPSDDVERFAGETADALAAAIGGVPSGVQGSIVLMEAPIAPLTVGAFDPLLTYRHDPDGSIQETDDYKRAWTTLASLPRLDPLKAAGAAAAVFILDASPANARGQYTPFIWEYQDLPALIVDRETGARLRQAAAAAPAARLVLEATLRQATSDSLVAILPGDGSTDETLIVNTHTDGQNAFEENAGIACVALARAFAALPRSARRRTLVFSCVTGHFGPGLPQTQGFIDDHPDLVDRAAAAVTIEHFGASEWLDDAQGYHASGEIELGAIFHSDTPIVDPAIASLQATDLRRSELLRPAAVTFFGVGAALHQAGVPSVAFIAGPNYLLALDGDRGHIDKLDARRMAAEVRWSADLLRRLDRIPAAQLAAGDSAVLRPGVAQ